MNVRIAAAALFCISGALLSYEFLLTRLLSLAYWGHFAGLVFSIALLVGSGANAIQLGVALFIMGVLFASAQTVHMTVAGDLSPPGQRGQTFGMWNLVAEIGAVLAPVLSGVLRDITGDWTLAILLDAVLLAVSAIMVSSIWLGRTTKRHALHRQ